jgi:hypothetical protein
MQAARATRKGVHGLFIKYSWISCTKRGSTCNELWISLAGGMRRAISRGKIPQSLLSLIAQGRQAFAQYRRRMKETL